MARPPVDISGFWVGHYGYDGSVSADVQFLATLAEGAGGGLSGTISEPNHMGMSSKELHAIVSGQRDGSDVFFAKTYDGASDAAHRVDYYGVLSDDRRRIIGHWSLAGASGTFAMSRELLDEEEEEAGLLVELDEPAGAAPRGRLPGVAGGSVAQAAIPTAAH